MPLLDHFHPPLHGPRRSEGFHHAWATLIAQHLNQGILPSDFYAEPEISLGPEMEIDVATLQLTPSPAAESFATAVWSPPRPKIAAKVDFARLDSFEIRVYQDIGGAELRAAIELISPANKDRAGSRRTFAAKCAGYLKHGIAVAIVDIVTARSANLHAELFKTLGVKGRRPAWQATTGLYAVAYRPVTVRRAPRVEAWPETLALGKVLPVLPLWLTLELCVPLRLEESYLATCQSLRIFCVVHRFQRPARFAHSQGTVHFFPRFFQGSASKGKPTCPEQRFLGAFWGQWGGLSPPDCRFSYLERVESNGP